MQLAMPSSRRPGHARKEAPTHGTKAAKNRQSGLPNELFLISPSTTALPDDMWRPLGPFLISWALLTSPQMACRYGKCFTCGVGEGSMLREACCQGRCVPRRKGEDVLLRRRETQLQVFQVHQVWRAGLLKTQFS